MAGKEHCRYDAYGRRILSWSPATGSIALSLYSQAGQILYQSAGSDSENIYLSGSMIAIRGRTAEGGYTVKYQHTDALGSPVAVTNTAGQVIDRTDWEPYGAAINKPSYNGIGFTGHVRDAATGLTYMQQRYYDPQCGCFLSVDPVTAYSNGDMRFFNRYAYAFNNPYKFTDPDGRCPLCAIVAGIFIYLTEDNANAPGPNDKPLSMPAGEQMTSAIPGGGRVASGAKMAIRQGERLSQRAATRQAKREAGIPTSQQPQSQTNGRASDGTQVGRQQTFETPKPGGGTEQKSVQVSRACYEL